MQHMFYAMGEGATNDWSLDLSNWNVCNVTSYDKFNDNVIDRITVPSFGVTCS